MPSRAGKVGLAAAVAVAAAIGFGASVAASGPPSPDTRQCTHSQISSDADSRTASRVLQVCDGAAPVNAGAAVASLTKHEIKRAQTDLNGLGYESGPADGIIRPQTRSAIKTFQFSRCIPVTGIFDAQTLGEMRIVIVQVQQAVGLQPNGIYTDATLAAVRSWQEAHGFLPASGHAGPITTAAMHIDRFIADCPNRGEVPPATTAQIERAQTNLNGLGYDAGSVNGIAGPQTTAAAKAFEADRCLTVDGIIGPSTLNELRVVTGQVQQAAGIPATGTYDEATITAVKSFQAAHGSARPTGVAGPVTMNLMHIERYVASCHQP